MSHKILVPIDFTEISETALAYAIGAAKVLNTGITLLHIVEKDEHINAIDQKLDHLINSHQNSGVDFKKHINQGDLYTGIGQAGKALNSGIIVMGTHGLKGLQYLFGSHANKIVMNSEIPILITQDRLPKNDNIDHIVMPIDLVSEEKQILSIVSKVAQTFAAKVHLFVAEKTDEFQKNAVHRNVSFAKRYLNEHGITFSTTHANAEEDFDKQIINYADLTNADVIAILNHHEDGIKNIFGTNFDQNIISNWAKIPVLMINAKTTSSVQDVFGVFS